MASQEGEYRLEAYSLQQSHGVIRWTVDLAGLSADRTAVIPIRFGEIIWSELVDIGEDTRLGPDGDRPPLADEGKELILADEAEQYYRRSGGDLPADRISEIRIGGALWQRVESDPGPGQRTVHGSGPSAIIQLGSPPLGLDVRAYDDTHGEWRALNE